MTSALLTPPAAPAAIREGEAVLLGACDGYRRGATGVVLRTHQGCAVFVPDAPERVASWARPRRQVLVPLTMVLFLA